MSDLSERVDAIIELGKRDDEAAHAHEDGLMQRWIRDNADDQTLREFERLWAADFSRWYA